MASPFLDSLSLQLLSCRPRQSDSSQTRPTLLPVPPLPEQQQRQDLARGIPTGQKAEPEVMIVACQGPASTRHPAEDGANNNKTRRSRKKLPGASNQLPEDGYSWLKYGHKNILSNTFSRAYYRCAMKGEGCVARKTVDFPLSEAKELCITYDGGHNHAAWPCAFDPCSVVVRHKWDDADAAETGSKVKKQFLVRTTTRGSPDNTAKDAAATALTQGSIRFSSPNSDCSPGGSSSQLVWGPAVPAPGIGHNSATGSAVKQDLNYLAPAFPTQEAHGMWSAIHSLSPACRNAEFSAPGSLAPDLPEKSLGTCPRAEGLNTGRPLDAGYQGAEAQASSTSEHGSSPAEHSPEVTRPFSRKARKPVLSLVIDSSGAGKGISRELSSFLVLKGAGAAVKPLWPAKRSGEGDCGVATMRPAKRVPASLARDYLSSASLSDSAAHSTPAQADSIEFYKLHGDQVEDFVQWSTLDASAQNHFLLPACTRLPENEMERDHLDLDLTLHL